MKALLVKICANYERSGNGAGQYNSKDVNEAKQFGHFNLEEAELKGGDNWKNFLQHEASNLLYWWHVMD